MSETPRTDAAKVKASHRIMLNCSGRMMPNQFSIEAILAEEFSTLERELNEAQKELSEAWNEAHCCDDVILEKPLAKFITNLREHRDQLRARVAELEADKRSYLQAFHHRHVNNGTDDACKQCGLDLRNPIHTAMKGQQ